MWRTERSKSKSANYRDLNLTTCAMGNFRTMVTWLLSFDMNEEMMSLST